MLLVIILKFELSKRVAANVQGLPQGWYFITVCPQLKPIEKLILKLTTKSQIEFGQARY
jgi:hypothetical protein